MANRIPLIVVSNEQLIKELPVGDDLDAANSNIVNANNITAGNISTTNLTTVNIATTGNVGFGISAANARVHIVGTTILEEILEKSNVSATAMGANANVDILECAIHFYTANSTANTTLNIRGNTTVSLNSVMSTNQSLTIAFVVTNGNVAYRVGNVQLDGANTTIRWSGGSAPTACTNSTEAYAFTIIKTGADAQYTLLGSKTQFA